MGHSHERLTERASFFKMGQAFRRVTAVYERYQVELDGSYSVDRLRELHAYSGTHSRGHCLLVMLLTPAPAVLTVSVLEIVPLNAPERGPGANFVFWGRLFAVTMGITVLVMEPARRFVPTLTCSRSFALLLCLVASLSSFSLIVALAFLIGFPVPFSMLCGSFAWGVGLSAGAFVRWGRHIRGCEKTQRSLQAYAKVMMLQSSLMFIYPAFNVVLGKMSGPTQTVVAMLRPVMKMGLKNALNRVIPPTLADLKPEVIIFNVELFHALFGAFSMQMLSSSKTTAVLVLMDFVQLGLNMYDIKVHMDIVQGIGAKIQSFRVISDKSLWSSSRNWLKMLDIAISFCQPNADLIKGSLPERVGGKSIKVAPERVPKGPSLVDTNDKKLYAASVLKVLRISEFILLVEFVELIIPIIYCLYLSIVARLPNRKFFPQFNDMNSDEIQFTIDRVLVLTVFEFASFLLLATVLRYWLRISTVHQVAFVLDHQWLLVQSKVVLWVVFAIQLPLIHFGFDYTFRFIWLRGG